MNVKLLKQVKAAVLAEPRRIRMQLWVRTNNSLDCGTVACIGGWAAILAETGPRPSNAEIKRVSRSLRWCGQYTASKALGLTSDQAHRLFFPANWPWHFWRQYEKAKTAQQRAEIAGERIDLFIESKGAK